MNFNKLSYKFIMNFLKQSYCLKTHQRPYSMLTTRCVVKAIRYDKSLSLSAIRYALKRVTIRKVGQFYAPFAVQRYSLTQMRL